MDARFVLVEIGKLSNQMESNTKALDKLSDKVGSIDDTIKTAKTVGWVLGGVCSITFGIVWWILSILWPIRGKLLPIISGQ